MDDERASWIVERAAFLLGMPVETAQAQFEADDEDLRPVIQNFLDGESQWVCLYLGTEKKKNETTKKTVLAAIEALGDTKPAGKCVVMIKNTPGRASPFSKKQQIFTYELHSDVLEGMQAAMTEYLIPTLCHPDNIGQLPSNVGKDLTTAAHGFVSTVLITAGNRRGVTLLPLPVNVTMPARPDGSDAGGSNNNNPLSTNSSNGSAEADSNPQTNSLPQHGSNGKTATTPDRPLSAASAAALRRDTELVRALEQCVVTWTRQIKAVLKQDAGLSLATENNSGPLAEIEFWQRRASNLSYIAAQLGCDKMQRVLKILEDAQSTFYPTLDRLNRDVSQRCREAADNAVYLRTLKTDFLEIEVEGFKGGFRGLRGLGGFGGFQRVWFSEVLEGSDSEGFGGPKGLQAVPKGVYKGFRGFRGFRFFSRFRGL